MKNEVYQSKAIGYRLYVKLIVPKKQGLIELPDSIKKARDQATTLAEVIEIGPVAWAECGGPEAWKCKPGSIISMNAYSYKDVSDKLDSSFNRLLDDDLYKVINDKDVINVYNLEGDK